MITVCTFLLADMWYVNADGKEGWLPSNILRAMIGDELIMSSGESTPVDIKLSSTGASADASDMSDSDGESHNYFSSVYSYDSVI